MLIFYLVLPFKAVNRGKGLLPDPTVMQILTGLNNPAALKMLLHPMVPGNKQGRNSLKSLKGGDLFCYCGFWCFIHVQAFLVQPLLSHCWPTLPFLLPCSRFCFRTRPKSNRYCGHIGVSLQNTASPPVVFPLSQPPIFSPLLVFSVAIQQAFLGNHLLWAQVLYS